MTAPGQRAAGEAAEDLADRRLLKWLRRQVNADLRLWRPAAKTGDAAAAGRVADCKAKLRLLGWADSWIGVRSPDHPFADDPKVSCALRADSVLVIGAVRYVAAAYRDRPGWRPEWEEP